MTIVQMQYFQAVCRYENFTRAAEELHISQPAMSAAMKDLEKECGVPLFVRDKNSLRVTDEGKILLEEANLVLGQYQQMNQIVRDLALTRNYMRVGLSTLSGNQVYPEILLEYQKRRPGVQVMSVEESTPRQFEMLDAGLLDVIITIRRFDQDEEQKRFEKVYNHWPMKQTRMCFCVGRENPLAGETFVTPEQIVTQPLVLLKENFSQTTRIKQMFRESGLDYHVLHYTNQMYTVERFVEKNVAAGFLPESVSQSNPKIVGIPYREGTRAYIELFWRKDQFLFPVVKEFIRVVKELYPKM